MKKLLGLLVLVLLLSCAPIATYMGSVIVSNETAGPASVTVDGVAKSIPAFDLKTWELSWSGDPWKTIVISIPGDVETYELWDGEVASFRVF